MGYARGMGSLETVCFFFLVGCWLVGWLVGWFLNVLVNYLVISQTGPKTKRLNDTELSDHDFCLSRSHYTAVHRPNQ